MGLQPELYNVADDPYELNDLAQARPDLVRSLTGELDRWWKVER